MKYLAEIKQLIYTTNPIKALIETCERFLKPKPHFERQIVFINSYFANIL